MKTRKKFDDGGSVMDKPSRDMRDPAYRRQLEREQALETSAPEFMLIGPGGAAKQLKNFVGTPTKFRGVAPEIGSATPQALHRKNLKDLMSFDDMTFAEKKALARSTTNAQIQAIKDSIQKSKSTPKEKLNNLVDDIIGGVARTAGYEALVNKKKGGVVKSASSRADGIAQRGKTRGNMR